MIVYFTLLEPNILLNPEDPNRMELRRRIMYKHPFSNLVFKLMFFYIIMFNFIYNIQIAIFRGR